MITNSPAGYLKAGVLWLALCSAGCASLAHRTEPPPGEGKGNAHYLEAVAPVSQKAYQCGPAALESVFRYWGQEADARAIADTLFRPGSRGVLDFTLSQYARDRGFWTQMRQAPGAESGMEELKRWILREVPPIVMLKTGVLWVPTYHFVVLKGFDDTGGMFYANVGEPETYAINYSQFRSRWKGAGDWYLIVCPPERVNWELNGAEAADLALTCDRAGKLGFAEKWYRRALGQNPANVTARFNLANIYLRSGRLEEAEVVYAALFKEKPDWGPAANNLAWVYLEGGRPQEAVRIIETAFRNGAEKRFDILDTLGVAYGRLKEYRAAREYLSEAARKAPPDNERILRIIHQHRVQCVAQNQVVLLQRREVV